MHNSFEIETAQLYLMGCPFQKTKLARNQLEATLPVLGLAFLSERLDIWPHRGSRWVAEMLFTIIDDIPRTVDFTVAKAVSIVPFLYNAVMIFQAIITEYFLYLPVGKSVIFIKGHVGNGKSR